jgi:hypothetical protein
MEASTSAAAVNDESFSLSPERVLTPISDDGPSSSTARFTPDSDSDDSDFGYEDNRGSQSFKLKQSHDAEKGARRLLSPGADGYEGGFRDMSRRASVSTVQSYQLYTPDEERAVVRKFDRKLVLFVAFLYMLSFLDRSSKFVLQAFMTVAKVYQILAMPVLPA